MVLKYPVTIGETSKQIYYWDYDDGDPIVSMDHFNIIDSAGILEELMWF